MPPLRARVWSYVRIPSTVGFLVLAALALIFVSFCHAQQPPVEASSPPASAKQDSETSEVKDAPTSPDATAPFKVRVNLVLVRVVVRDSDGKVIPNLKKNDFELRDDRKPQAISSFSVETPASHTSRAKLDVDSVAAPSEANAVKAPAQPQRFVALFFDDLHLSMKDILFLRQAATRLFKQMGLDDRLATFTASGTVHQEFTADRDKLDESLGHMQSRSESIFGLTDCPPMTFYEAYQILEGNDPDATQLATADAAACSGGAPGAGALVQSAARSELSIGESNIQVAFRSLDTLIQRMSALRGQRIIVMMSPGFFVSPSMDESKDVIEQAIKANVVINTIDARGLYTSSVYDGSNQSPGAQVAAGPIRQRFISSEEVVQNQVLAELADGSGGSFFHDRNDVDQGLLRATAEPEVSYILGFTPQNLKFDGKYHNLKVTLTSGQKGTLQARHGYFAPRKALNPEEAADQEIDEAVFSLYELRQLPLECQTQIFKDEKGARLTVIARVDARSLKFLKVEDRNKDVLRIVMALFDDNGGFLSGKERDLTLLLKDSTLAAIDKTGIRVKFDFDVQPGTFTVRVVARDSEGAQLGATSRRAVVPN